MPLKQTIEKVTTEPKPKTGLLKTPSRFSRRELTIFIAMFGLIGFFTILYHSFAAMPLVATLEAEQMSLPAGGSVVTDSTASAGKAIQLLSNGTATGSVNFSSPVTSITVSANGSQCSGSPTMAVLVDGVSIISSTSVSSTSWSSFTASVNLNSGTHSLAITAGNLGSASHGKKNICSRTLYLDVTNFYGPAPVQSAPTVALSATPTSVTAGQASTLTWSSTNASSCAASGAWSGAEPTSGSVSTGALNQDSVYTLTCTGSGGTASASATISVSSGACVNSSTAWQNNSLPSQTGIFTEVFSLTPSASNIDADMGLSAGPAAAYTDLAAIIEFNTSGNVVARNGGSYSAVTPLTYVAGATYSVRMVVNVPLHTYDVYVTPPGGTEVVIASGYGFRTEQAAASQLANWATISTSGSEKICGLPVATSSSSAAGTVGCVGPSCSGKLPAPDTSKGTKYYISNTGSLSNNGTSSASPWPFSQASASIYKPGDSVNFACGQSFGFLTINTSGTTGLPVIYQTDGTCGQATFAGIDAPGRSWVTLYKLKSYVTGYLDTSYTAHGTYIALEIDSPSAHVTVQGSDLSTSGGVGSDALIAGNPNSNNITYLMVDSTILHGTGDSAVYLYGSNNTFQYSQFYGNGGKCPSGCGTHSIYMKAEYSTFAFNDFGSISGGQSLSLRRSHETIYGNLFHDNPDPMAYFAEDSGGGTTLVYNNRFQNTNGYMIYIDDNTDHYTGTPNINVVWANNTTQGTSTDYLFPIYKNGGSFKAYNNIAMGTWAGAFNSGSSSVTQANNQWFTVTGIGSGPDYLLQSGSNAINSGTTSVSGLTYSNSCNMQPLSYCGSTVDIGARESTF